MVFVSQVKVALTLAKNARTGTSIAITILLLACAGFSQERTEVKNEKAAVQYLLEKKSGDTEADRFCVDDAFQTLGFATRFRNKNTSSFWWRCSISSDGRLA